MDTIHRLTSITPLGSATSEGRHQQSQQNTLPPGQLFKAVVVEAKGGGRYVLDIGGSRLSAESQAPLSLGQNLRLEVTNTTPQVELKIVSDTQNQFIGRSLTLVGKGIDLSTLVQQLSQPTSPLQGLSPASRSIIEGFFSLQQAPLGTKEGGTVLKQLMEGVGLKFEHHLARGDTNSAAATLKAALLEIAHTVKNTEPLANTAQKLITGIELFQLAQVNANSEAFVIFPLPLPFIEAGFLTVDKDGSRDGTSDPEDCRFSLHLTMSELGHICVDFVKLKKSLMIRFRAESAEKMQFIEQFSGELVGAITDTADISVVFSQDAPDPVTDLLGHLVPKGQSIVDTRV